MPFGIVVAPIYNPNNNAQKLPCVHIFTTLAIISLFDNSYSDRYEVMSYCGFDLPVLHDQ